MLFDKIDLKLKGVKIPIATTHCTQRLFCGICCVRISTYNALLPIYSRRIKREGITR